METACELLLQLLNKCDAHGWSAALADETDDYERFLSVQMERLEDMGPTSAAQEAANAHLIRAVEMLLEATERLRQEQRGAAIRSLVEEADALFARAQSQ